MDHALRTISYIADIGDVLVVMARRGSMNNSNSPGVGEPAGQDQATSTSTVGHNQAKICCHVFESDEVIILKILVYNIFLLFWGFPLDHLGPVDCTVYQPSIPGCLHRIPEGQRYQWSRSDQGDGLSGCPESARNLWRGVVFILKQGHAKRGWI